MPRQVFDLNLAVIDIHCHFETKAKVIVTWCFPFHIGAPLIKNNCLVRWLIVAGIFGVLLAAISIATPI